MKGRGNPRRVRDCRARERISGRAGFTLIEITISLVAGLIVAIAVMGVSREATTTFHEEVRVAGAEMGLRVAVERLRLDLQRAAYMSTGNIVVDPLVAKLASANDNLSNVTAPPFALKNLSGVFIHPGGAVVTTDATTSPELVAQAIAPDAIDIAANFSSADEFVGSVIWNPPGVPAGCGAGAAINVQMNTPAGWRIQQAETAVGNNGHALRAMFRPGENPASQFALRVTDSSGHYQYLLQCPGVGATTYTPGATPVATVFISTNSTILTTNQTGGLGGVSGFGAGWVVVSPIQIAHWDIVPVVSLPAPVQGFGPTAPAANTFDPDEFVLTRAYVDFAACTGASCPADPLTTEVIAEYAVDLRFGITVDETRCTALPCPIAAPALTGNPLHYFPIDGASAPSAYTAVASPAIAGQGPQRIRDVQFRVGVRSQFGDRPTALPGAGSYLYRYKLGANALHGNAKYPFARVREISTVVNLPNQARFYW